MLRKCLRKCRRLRELGSELKYKPPKFAKTCRGHKDGQGERVAQILWHADHILSQWVQYDDPLDFPDVLDLEVIERLHCRAFEIMLMSDFVRRVEERKGQGCPQMFGGNLLRNQLAVLCFFGFSVLVALVIRELNLVVL